MSEAQIMCIDNEKFKIACCNYNVSVVINFFNIIKNSEFKLNCIDITQDFAGSFDKAEVTRHLIDNYSFVEESYVSKSHPTIIRNIKSLHICLQFYLNKSLRCKIHLKMPESLQSRSVKSDVGNLWLEWANKEN